MISYIEELYKKNVNPKDIFINEPMKKHTSFKIGGNADVFVKAASIEEIQEVVSFANQKNIPLFIIGNGSNVLVKDEGIRGIVIKPELKDIQIKKLQNKVEVKVQSGVTLAYLAQKLLQEEVRGFEEFSGIPGTIGGAIRMNAGAHGKEMKDIVERTKYIDRQGNIIDISKEEHEFNYRNSIFSKNKYIILETVLELEVGKREEIIKKMQEYANWRIEKQPLEYPSAGSTFKRGEDFVTAKLIDECGLKGYKIGGAQVSEKHAGFIVNTGDATAQNVIDLIEYVKEQVYKKFNKKIELEIEII